MLLPFRNPKSVIQRAPMSGAFGTDDYLSDKEGFIARIMGYWLCVPGNSYPCETRAHFEFAESLFDFYVVYRKRVTSEKLRGYPLLVLYRSGVVSEALKTLKAG